METPKPLSKKLLAQLHNLLAAKPTLLTPVIRNWASKLPGADSPTVTLVSRVEVYEMNDGERTVRIELEDSPPVKRWISTVVELD